MTKHSKTVPKDNLAQLLSYNGCKLISDLCLQCQLVGCFELSKLQSKFKLVFWVSGHSQRLLFETLGDTGECKLNS